MLAIDTPPVAIDSTCGEPDLSQRAMVPVSLIRVKVALFVSS